MFRWILDKWRNPGVIWLGPTDPDRFLRVSDLHQLVTDPDRFLTVSDLHRFKESDGQPDGGLAAALGASRGVNVDDGSADLARRVIDALAFTKDSRTLIVIDMSFCNIGNEGVRTLAQRLPAGLQRLSLWGNNIDAEGAKALAKGLPMGLKKLDLGENSIGDEGAEALGAGLPRDLQNLDLRDNGIGNKGVQALVVGLPGGLETLILDSNSFDNEGLQSLAANLPAGLKSIQLGLSDEDEETLLVWLGQKEPLPVADVLLQFFSTESGRARAKALLESNRRRLATLQGLHNWPSDFVTARNVRVLFCGNANVGKTCLRRSVRRQGQQPLEVRTRGIEVEYFKEQGLHFLLWDMGGQQEFHILHSYLMPDVSFASHKATVFVLVLKVKEISISSLEAVRYWFKLIASTTAPGKMRQVMVILNLWDGKKWGKEVKEYKTELTRLRDLHQKSIVLWDVLDIDVRQEDAGSAMWQKIIKQRSNCSEEVPIICQQVVDQLPEWRAENTAMPVMDEKIFEQRIKGMLNRHLGEKNMGGSWSYDTFYKSLLQYLQDSGQIVHFGSSTSEGGRRGWVVLDTSWLGHDVVGQLLGLRLHAKAGGISCKDGMVVAAHMAFFFNDKGYDWDFVKQLLIELNLCYDVPGTQERPMLFVPALFNEDRTWNLSKVNHLHILLAISAAMRWNLLKVNHLHVLLAISGAMIWNLFQERRSVDEQHILGIRVKCRQANQFMLGLPFFWRLQSMIANKLKPQKLANHLRLSSYARNGVDINVTYEEEQDELHIFATQVFGTPTPNLVLRQLGLCYAFITEAAAKDRIGVAIHMSVLHPVCLQNVGQGVAERDHLYWWEQMDLRERLSQDGEEATLGCNPKSKHAVLVKHITELPADSSGALGRMLQSGVPLVEGVWCLFEPKGSAKFDVVFFSGPRTSWSTRDGSVTCWPMEWLPEALPQARLLEVKFPLHLSLWESAINDTQALTMGDFGSRPYFLVGHSLGGVLAKEVLLRADRTYQELRAKCKGVVFYGVPQLDELPIKSALFGISESDMCQFDPNESLKRYVDFQPLRAEFPTHCFVENMETTMGDKKMMVSKRSGADGADASALTFVGDADHFQVCRPRTKDDLTVKLLVHFISKASGKWPEP